MEGGSDLIIGIVAQMKETTEANRGVYLLGFRNPIKCLPWVRESERGRLSSFLESGSGMEGGSDLIIGIVAQIKETAEANLAESTCKDSAILMPPALSSAHC